MSKTKNAMFQTWKSLLDSRAGSPAVMSHHELTRRDSLNYYSSVVAWGLVLRDFGLSGQTGVERQCSDACLLSWASRLMGEDIEIIFTQCKNLLACIRHWQPHMGCATLRSFKHFAREQGVLLSLPLFDPIRGLAYRFARTYDANDFRWLNTFCQFISRLTLQDVDWIADEAIQKYIDEEEQLASYVYDENLLREINAVLMSWLKDLDITAFSPRHSNGATNVVKREQGISEKYKACHFDCGTSMFFRRYGVYDPRIIDSCGVVRVPCAEVPLQSLKGQLVPKGINKKRFISMEDTLRQYCQNQVRRALDAIFRTNRDIRVCLQKQSLNADMALYGSGSLHFGTIDLSSASDTVTWSLVKQVFRGTKLYPALVMLRTKRIDLPNKSGERSRTSMSLNKAFGMGSNLCFPIECLVFAAVSHVACQHMGLDSNYRVYGDDIVIDSRCFNECVRILELLHFNVNQEKSFGPYSHFLESCGVEAYCGKDVTPFRISRWYDWNACFMQTRTIRDAGNKFVVPNSTSFLGMIEFCNRAYEWGFMSLRMYLVHSLMSRFSGIPFHNGKGLLSDYTSNYRLMTRYNKQLQRLEYRVLITSVRSTCDIGARGRRSPEKADAFDQHVQYYGVLEQYEQTERRELLDPLDLIEAPVVGTTTLRFRFAWDPLY